MCCVGDNLLLILYYYVCCVLCGFIYSLVMCVISPELDISRRVYLSSVSRVFAWASKYSSLPDCSPCVTFKRQNSGFNEESDAITLTHQQNNTHERVGLIHRDAIEMLRTKLSGDCEPAGNKLACLQVIVDDVMDYVTAGMEAVVDDEFGSGFQVPELTCWNMLSRTRSNYNVVSKRLQAVWILGFVFRFVVLVPVRVLVLIFCLIFMGVGSLYFTVFPASLDSMHRGQAEWFIRVVYRLMSRSASVIAFHHSPENHPLYGALCVANHTSPIDIVPLNCIKAYSLTGQKHTGMIGYFEHTLQRIVPCLWFDRSSLKDREKVKRALHDFVHKQDNPPVLIFPEGVCVNNTTTIRFKKGSFEATNKVHPIAIKFDRRFGDPFWHQDLWTQHLWDMMTSWAIVVDVWYMPPMERLEHEESADFADRVAAAISEKAGLRRLHWDGMLRQYIVRHQDVQKDKYSKHLKQHVSLPNQQS